MGGQPTGLVAAPRPSSPRSLSKCRKSLEKLLATLLFAALQIINKRFQQLSPDLSSSRARVARARAMPGEASAARVPDIALIAAITGQATRSAQSSPAAPGIAGWCKITQCFRVAARTREDGTMRIDQAVNIEDLHRMAKRRLPKIAFDFIEGGLED